MRELKFRAWGINIKEYLKDVDGGANCVYILGDLLKQGNWIFEQYIGLKDKNGKEIYEGDIISFENEKAHAGVLWLDGKAMFGIKWLGCGIEDEFDFDNWGICRGPIEVIGNIHENPELLGGEE